MRVFIAGIPAFAAFGPLILLIGVRSVGAIGFGFALIGGLMITAAFRGVSSLLASQAKEIELLKKRLAGDESGEVS